MTKADLRRDTAMRVINFLPYQKTYLDDKSRFKLAMFARQTGKTFTTGGEAVSESVDAQISGERTRWVILSRGERQSIEMMKETIQPMTRAFWEIYGSLVSRKEPVFSEGEFRSPQAGNLPDAIYRSVECEFPDGSRITALPANPDTARGFSANVMLDEFAFHQKSRDIWKALFPVISKGGLKLRVVSTPNGKSNMFHTLVTSEDKAGWSKHIVDIYDAVAQGLDRNIDELRAALNDEDAWAQEFELKFLDEASAWLTYDQIASVEDEKAGDPDGYLGGPCFVGVDIAARQDLFVIWVLEQVGDVLWTREIITRKRAKFAEQDQLLDEVFARYRVVRCAMDQTGMGEKPVEDAQRRHGENRVEGVLFSAARKLGLATALKERFEDRTMRIPMGDVALRADLHSVKKEVGITGAPRLIADRDANGHADRFWAGALATAAGETSYQPYAYRPVKQGRDPNADRSPLQRTGGFKRTGAW